MRDIKPHEIELVFHDRGYILEWPIEFRADSGDLSNHDGFGSVPPYPAVVLGEWEIGGSFPVRVESHEHPQDREPGPSPFGGVADGQYTAEMRFCIVPNGPEMQPQPALRFVPTAGFLDADATVPSTGRIVSCRLSCDTSDVPSVLLRHFDISEARGIAWQACRFFPISGTVLADWLGGRTLGESWWPSDKELHVRALGPPVLAQQDGTGFSHFQAGTIAAALDRCLCGMEGPDLLDMLDERAAHFKELFAEAQANAERARTAGYARLQRRLDAMCSNKE